MYAISQLAEPPEFLCTNTFMPEELQLEVLCIKRIPALLFFRSRGGCMMEGGYDGL